VSKGDSLKGLWTQDFQLLHFNGKELMALGLVLQGFPLTPTSSILVFLDNSSLLKQAKLSEVIGFSKPINLEFQSGEAKQINLTNRHIPGTLNTEADALSRPIPIAGEWSLDLKSSGLL
jgi:ATP sulfurylase